MGWTSDQVKRLIADGGNPDILEQLTRALGAGSSRARPLPDDERDSGGASTGSDEDQASGTCPLSGRYHVRVIHRTRRNRDVDNSVTKWVCGDALEKFGFIQNDGPETFVAITHYQEKIKAPAEEETVIQIYEID